MSNIYRVLIFRHQVATIHVQADSAEAAELDAMELVEDADYNDEDFGVEDSYPLRVEPLRYWTGGEDGHWVERERD